MTKEEKSVTRQVNQIKLKKSMIKTKRKTKEVIEK